MDLTFAVLFSSIFFLTMSFLEVRKFKYYLDYRLQKTPKMLHSYCINIYLVQSCSVSINSCKSESVKLSREATLKVTNGQNSWTGWANACIKH